MGIIESSIIFIYLIGLFSYAYAIEKSEQKARKERHKIQERIDDYQGKL